MKLNKLIQDLHMIFEAIKSYPMSTKQICEYLKSHHKYDLLVYEVRQYLWDELKSFVSYNKYEFSYTLKENIDFENIKQLLERRYKRKINVPSIVNPQYLTLNQDLFKDIYDYEEKNTFSIAQSFLKDEFFNLENFI